MHAALLTGNQQTLSETIQKIEVFQCANDIQQMAVFSYKTPFLLIYLQQSGLEKELMEAIDNAFEKVKLFGEKLRFDVRANIIVSCMSGAIELGSYPKAVEWAVLFRSFDIAERLDSLMIIDMLALIAHTELNELRYVQNLSQAIYQRALRWGEKGKFESAYLSFFKKISTSINKDEQQIIFDKTQAAISNISPSDISSQNRTLFPIFDAYLKSKVAKVPYHLYAKTTF